ncbi:MAG: hypothetical protein AB7I24_05560 [Candidatus Nanopelagicales bacterium]
MHLDPTRNADRMPLHADHTRPRALVDGEADRLILGTCNLILGAILGNKLRSRKLGGPGGWRPRRAVRQPPAW